MKELVEEKRGYPASHQTLSFSDVPQQDHDTLFDHRIIKGCFIEVSLKTFPISIMEASGRICQVQVQASDTIGIREFILSLQTKT